MNMLLGKSKDPKNLFQGKFIIKSRQGRLLAIRKDGWGIYINHPKIRRNRNTNRVRMVLVEKYNTTSNNTCE